MTDRPAALRVLAALRHTPVGDTAVLVGSSGLFGFETEVPALTEDIDVCVPEAVVASHGDEIVGALEGQGCTHDPGTATFVSPDGITFDLLGHGAAAGGDHIAGSGLLRVMVYADLSLLVGTERATSALPGGGSTLSPAGFVVCKLLTERGHKGAKDKLQALLVLAERRSEAAFTAQVRRLLAAAGRERREDVRAAAHEALISLGRDPAFADAGAEGYLPVLHRVELGLEALRELLEGADG